MSRYIRRRTGVLLLAASLGLLGAIEAQAGGSRRADRLTAAQTPLAIQLQDFARILWREAADVLTGFLSAPDGSHREGHKPRVDCTGNGPAIDPDGRSNGNDRNGNSGNHYGPC